MTGKSLIVRFNDVYHQNENEIQRLYGTVDASNIIKLIDPANLQANPRESKAGPVTDAIAESLDKTPELFQFKSKGILVAVSECRPLERNRFELHFDDSEIDGILDGGHNTLGIALYLLNKAREYDQSIKFNRIKIWKDLSPVWNEYSDDIRALAKKLNFLVPLEILYPKTEYETTFTSNILEIAQARNNNVQLTTETKAHKAGYYDCLKKSLDPEIANQVEWKTNDGGQVKSKDLVALSLIPISLISDSIDEKFQINPQLLYSSKEACLRIFNDIYEHENVSVKEASKRVLNNDSFASALSLMEIIPDLFDYLYERFPVAYNKASPGFGRISCVKNIDNKKGKGSFKTKFYSRNVDFKFPDGFIYPLVYALRELMQVNDEGKVEWKVEPFEFLDKHLNEIVEPYQAFVIKLGADYDPQKVGKTLDNYKFACREFKNALIQ